MKVVWISHIGGLAGGADMSFWEAARGLRERGIEVHGVFPQHGELAERLESIGGTYSCFPFYWWVFPTEKIPLDYYPKSLARNFIVARKLARLFKELRCDLVLTNTLATPLGAMAARLAKLPHIWYIHELFGKVSHGNHFAWGDRLSLSLINRLSDKIIVNSQAVLNHYQKHFSKDKLRQVYYAVDVPRAPAKALERNGALRLIQVGAVSPGKRAEDAVRALSLLKRKGLNLRLTLLGGEVPEYGQFLRKLAQELEVERLIEFVPFAADPFAYMADADLALMCSRGEAFGRVTIEAMKLGKPVIGADSMGTAELIQNHFNGLLYPLADAGALAGMIEILYDNRPLLDEMGRNAQEWAYRKFSMENYVNGLLEVFDEALYCHA